MNSALQKLRKEAVPEPRLYGSDKDNNNALYSVLFLFRQDGYPINLQSHIISGLVNSAGFSSVSLPVDLAEFQTVQRFLSNSRDLKPCTKF